MKFLIAVVLLLAPLAAAAQATGNCSNQSLRQCNDSQAITASGTSITIPSNGGLVPSFEELFSGGPATVSIVIQGCGPSLTCETLDTYTTATNAIRSPTLIKTYQTFKVTATWTGGTNVSVQVNTTITAAQNLGGISGMTSNGSVITSSLQLQVPAGSVAAPGLAIGAPGAGWYSRASVLEVTNGGSVSIMQINGTGVVVDTNLSLAGGSTVSNSPNVYMSNTAANTISCGSAAGSANCTLKMGPLTSAGAVTFSGLTNSSTGDYVCYNATVIGWGTATCTLSLRKYKMDIASLVPRSSLLEVMRMNPVQYRYIPSLNRGSKLEVGLIADEVEKVDRRLAAYSADGQLHSVDYEHMTALLLSAIQEQQKEIAQLKRDLRALVSEGQ